MLSQSNAFETMKLNPYEKVAHLMPEETSIMHRILVACANYDLLTDQSFHEMLE